MAQEHEKLIKKILNFRFKPEGYVSTGDMQFLEQLMDALAAHGLDPNQLVYRGFDASTIDMTNGLPREPFVYAMNVAGWKQAVDGRQTTPAEFAEGQTPCIAVYDGNLLAAAYSAKHLNSEQDDMSIEPIKLGDIIVGDKLVEMVPGRVVNEEVVHVNFPDGSPTDALVALVRLDD